MKKGFVALSVLSGMFLASSAMAAPSQWVGSPAEATASFDIKNMADIGFGVTAPKEFTFLKKGDEVFRLEITAPVNVKVAVAGKINPMFANNGGMVQDDFVSGGDVAPIVVQAADQSLMTDDKDYIPFGASTALDTRVVVVDGSAGKISIPFITATDYPLPSPGKKNYTFLAQAFVE